MAHRVEGDILRITLPTKDEDGNDLPACEVVGASWLPFAQKRRVQSYAQKETIGVGYVTDMAKMSEMCLSVWAQRDVSGRIRDRKGAKLLPFAADTASSDEARYEDLDYISLVCAHVFFPQEFPFAPPDPSDEASADPNVDEPTPITPKQKPPKGARTELDTTA